MPLDPRAKRLLDMLALGAPTDPGLATAAERRAGFRALMALSRTPVPIGSVEDRVLDGPGGALPVRRYTPAGVPDPLLSGLVFFHGGGLVAGDLDTHDRLCRMLANAGRCRIVAVDYRLAPEYRFPAAIEDAVAATRAVAAQAEALGIDPGRLAVGGDSAGGTLAILAATSAREAGGPALRFMLLLCPVLDLSARRPSRLAFGRGFLLDQATMDRDLADYLVTGAAVSDPRVSPLLAETLAGLPPCLIHTAEYDPMRDEGQAYAERLEQAEVAVRHTCHAGMIHHFFGLDGLIPAAAAALQGIGAEMREGFG